MRHGFGEMLKKKKLLFFIAFSGLLTSVCISAETLRDPTRPLTYQVKEKKKIELKLQAIFDRSGSKEAVINGQQLKVGDKIAGGRITRITHDKVLYTANGTQHTLKLRASIF